MTRTPDTSCPTLIADIEQQLADDGRVLVRYRGTRGQRARHDRGIDESRIRVWSEDLAGGLAKSCRT